MNPDSPLINKPSGDKQSDLVQKELERSIGNFEAVERDAREQGLNGAMIIRQVANDAILWHMCRADGRAICMPYLLSVLPSNSPVIELERSTPDGLLIRLEGEFDFLWSRAGSGDDA
jgi:hypothetical protein